MDIYEVVKRLTGRIDPIGETYEDNRRFANLKTLIELTDKLLTEIDEVATENKDRREYSMQRAGKFCDEFLDKIGITK